MTPPAEDDRPLAGGYRVDAYDGQDEVTAQDVIAFWEREGVLTPEERAERVHELLLVARTADGELAGVSTAFLAHENRLGAPMWNFRALVGREHRRSFVGLSLARDGRDLLAARYASGADTRAPGVLMEIENVELSRQFPQAHWHYIGFWFVGHNALGQDVRVCWFPGALAPDPPR